jgi:uncharacterized protein (TIGR03437 family)
MRFNRLSLSLWLAGWIASASPLFAASLGTVVPIGGTASDIVLDESRGYLYIADFGSNTVDFLSLSDLQIHTSLNVAPQPGALAMSPDGSYLVVTHYNATASGTTAGNLVTIINLANDTQMTLATGEPPLGVAFLNVPDTRYPSGIAVVVTTANIWELDPVSGRLTLLTSLANVSTNLPAQAPASPGQITEAALASNTAGDGLSIWGIGGATTGTSQIVFKIDGHSWPNAPNVYPIDYMSSPPLLPRVSVAADGSYAIVGYSLVNLNGIIGRFPNIVTSKNITGHAIDSTNGILYGQIPDATQPSGPVAASSSPTVLPGLLIMSANNMAVQDRLVLPENLVGRAVLNAAATVMYAISESGVTVIPVGSLNRYHRLNSSAADVLLETNYCNRSTVTGTFTLSDPGGNHTDFSISSPVSGVTISPASGTTPATITVTASPSAFSTVTGTSPVNLTVNSVSAVNAAKTVRVLVSNPDVNQRGTIVDVPGVLGDIVADASRNRFYIAREDQDQVLVFDGSTNKQMATLPTVTTPMSLAITNDSHYLLVGHNDSQLVTVYDLDALQLVSAIVLPGGHYARSLAVSNSAILALVRDEGTGTGAVDSLDIATELGTKLSSLGAYANSVSPQSALAAAPNGATVLLADPGGTVMLYSAASNTFTVARQDFTALGGAIAASSYNQYIVGNNVFNASLVPVGTLAESGGSSSGFLFTGQGGYFATAASNTSPGVIQNYTTSLTGGANPIAMVEAPLLPSVSASASGSSTSSTSSSSSSTSSTSTTSAAMTFTRTVAAMPADNTVVALTTSGFTVLSANYGASAPTPIISSVVNAANNSTALAPGALISVYGTSMSPVNVATSQIPLPTALGQSCLSVNGTPVPLLFVSGTQVNAQLPYNVGGNAALSIHTPGGVSNNYNFTVGVAAPSIFMSGTAGPLTGLPTIVRNNNNQLITPTNPIYYNDSLTIYANGLGLTSPQVTAGSPAPSSPLASAVLQPTVTLGGVNLNVSYAGLMPGGVGVYQINASVPSGVPQGLSVPLVINQGGAASSVNVRVVGN